MKKLFALFLLISFAAVADQPEQQSQLEIQPSSDNEPTWSVTMQRGLAFFEKCSEVSLKGVLTLASFAAATGNVFLCYHNSIDFLTAWRQILTNNAGHGNLRAHELTAGAFALPNTILFTLLGLYMAKRTADRAYSE